MSTTQARCLHVAHYDGEPDRRRLPGARRSSPTRRCIGSAGVVLAHNHPSGDAAPERSRLSGDAHAGRAPREAIDLAILDHLIFAGRECSSMRRMGLL